MKKILILTTIFSVTLIHASTKYTKTVENVDIPRFMGTWYVMAARPTPFEKGAFNSIEQYDLDEESGKIQITFTFNKDSFDGDLKTIKQGAQIYNDETMAHWKVSPFWPIKFDVTL